MKTQKIVLLVSTIIALLFSTVSIISIITGTIELPQSQNGVEISSTSQLIYLFIVTIANIISIIFINKDIITHKKKIIVLNIVQLLFGTIINIISAIINIVIVSKKNKVKKILPILEDITKYKWYIYFIIFVVLLIICYTPLTNLLFVPQTFISALIFTVALYIIQIFALVIPMFGELKRDFKALISNFKLYISNMLPRFGLIFIFYLFASILLSILINEIPNNQAILNGLPIYVTAFLAIFIGPLTEELMFRGFMKKFIKNDLLFIILSSLIFGGLHILSANSLPQIAYIIPYSILGFAFSLNYVKTKNIASNIFLHSAWNTIVVILMSISNI